MRPSASQRRATTDATSAVPVDIVTLWKVAKKHDATRLKQLILQSNAATGSLSILNQFHPKKGTTPLMVACKKRDKSYRNPQRSGADTVQMLLEFGADMDVKDRCGDGHTALHYAAISNHVRAVEFMLHTGVSAYILNDNGHAAIDLARWHRSRDVLDVLTAHTRIHNGWLYVKKIHDPSSSSLLHVWKKRWAVALACDAHRDVVELSLFKDRDDIKPQHVILLKPETHSMVASPKKKWLDRHNMFHVDRAVVLMKSKAKRRFSRDESEQQRCEMAGDVVRMQFAAENVMDRDAWMAILLRRRVPLPARDQVPRSGESVMSVPEEYMRWPSPVPMATLPDHQQRPMTATQHDPFGGEMNASASATSPPHMDYDRFVAEMQASPPSAPTFIGSVDGYDGSPSFYEQLSHGTHSLPIAVEAEAIRASSSGHSESESQRPTMTAEPAGEGVLRSECVICMDATRDAICVPCGHVAGCHACLLRHVTDGHSCPICRGYVHTVIKIYEC